MADIDTLKADVRNDGRYIKLMALAMFAINLALFITKLVFSAFHILPTSFLMLVTMPIMAWVGWKIERSAAQ